MTSCGRRVGRLRIVKTWITCAEKKAGISCGRDELRLIQDGVNVAAYAEPEDYDDADDDDLELVSR